MTGTLTPDIGRHFESVRPDDWRERASCLGLDTDLFIPEGKGQHVPEQVWRICASCPVAQFCFDFALTTHSEHGIWGGSTPRQRRRSELGDPAPATRRCDCGGIPATPRAARCRRCNKARAIALEARRDARDMALVEARRSEAS